MIVECYAGIYEMVVECYACMVPCFCGGVHSIIILFEFIIPAFDPDRRTIFSYFYCNLPYVGVCRPKVSPEGVPLLGVPRRMVLLLQLQLQLCRNSTPYGAIITITITIM